MTKIVQKGESVLHTPAQEVAVADITKPKIQKLLQNMREALEKENDGVAIAAPQIGEAVRIFIVSPLAFKPYKDQPLIYINPVITNTSKTKKWLEEGCLSVRWFYGKTHRYEKVTVEAYNEQGEKFSRGGSGLLAQIFQHEIDHLNGILFVDHAKYVTKLSDEEIAKMEKENNSSARV